MLESNLKKFKILAKWHSKLSATINLCYIRWIHICWDGNGFTYCVTPVCPSPSSSGQIQGGSPSPCHRFFQVSSLSRTVWELCCYLFHCCERYNHRSQCVERDSPVVSFGNIIAPWVSLVNVIATGVSEGNFIGGFGSEMFITDPWSWFLSIPDLTTTTKDKMGKN